MLTNIDFTEKLLNTSKYLLVLPSTKKNKNDTVKCFKNICLIYSIITVTCFLYFSKERFKNIYNDNNSTVLIIKILDQVSQTSSGITRVSMSVYITFLTFDPYLQLFEKLGSLKEILHDSCYESKQLFKIFLVFEGCVVPGLIYNIIIHWSKYGVGIYKYFFWKDIEFFQWTLNAFMMFSLVLSIENLFKEINYEVLDKMEQNLKHKFSIYQMGMMFDIERSLKLRKSHIVNHVAIYEDICKLVEDFNDVFGFNFILIVVNCILELLFNAGLLAVHGLRTGKPLDGLFYDADLLVPRFHRIAVLLMVPAMLAYACECAVAEASRIATISLIYLNEFPILPEKSEDILLKEELTTLFNKGSFRTPMFSAAGFFDMNYSMLGLIIGSTVSYIIVTLALVGD